MLTQQLDGRVYPNSQSAKSVFEVFSLRLEGGKVRIHLEGEVLKIHKDSKHFFMQSTKGIY
ncbi:NAD(P)/FAD-dependent oxidoreductase [Helicobacter apodemus]|uniref:NAD(P)/FAD-dependent oxidoreductase n=1 Tax=Helicobacter apodemus TaxID=135569 RepID=UPI000689B15C